MTTEKHAERDEHWLNCKLEKGMFSSEVVVIYPPEGECIKSAFVPKYLVQGNIGSAGQVRVAIARSNGKLLALLPTNEDNIVEVAEADLLTIAATETDPSTA